MALTDEENEDFLARTERRVARLDHPDADIETLRQVMAEQMEDTAERILALREALTTAGRQMIAMAVEHEAALMEARNLGIETEALRLWDLRCAEARGTFDRPPTLRQCVREILRRGAPSGPVTVAELKSILRKQPCP